MAAEVANRWGWTVEAYPADWDGDGKAAGPKRNARMVAAEPRADVCVAFVLPGARGTWDCARRAVDAGIKFRAVSP